MGKAHYKYIVDTDALINLRELPNIDNLWPRIEDLVDNGSFKTVNETFCELKKFKESFNWYKKFKPRIVINSKIQYAEAVTKKLGAIENAGKSLIDWTVLGPCEPADPWLIAIALAYEYTVVTEEKRKGAGFTNKIPYVCRKLGVRCIGIENFITEI